jgi:hypothetical protein
MIEKLETYKLIVFFFHKIIILIKSSMKRIRSYQLLIALNNELIDININIKMNDEMCCYDNT